MSKREEGNIFTETKSTSPANSLRRARPSLSDADLTRHPAHVIRRNCIRLINTRWQSVAKKGYLTLGQSACSVPSNQPPRRAPHSTDQAVGRVRNEPDERAGASLPWAHVAAPRVLRLRSSRRRIKRDERRYFRYDYAAVRVAAVITVAHIGPCTVGKRQRGKTQGARIRKRHFFFERNIRSVVVGSSVCDAVRRGIQCHCGGIYRWSMIT